VGATPEDSKHAVSGTITISNPAPKPATLTSVKDVVAPGGIEATVHECKDAAGNVVSFSPQQPYELVSGGTLTCSYSTPLPDDKFTGKNVATATLQNYKYDPAGNKTTAGTTSFDSLGVDVSFANATVDLVDESITVSDSYTGLGSPQGVEVKANEAPKTFNYKRTIGPYTTSGDYQVDNRASYIAVDDGNDTGEKGHDDWSIVVHVLSNGTLKVIKFYDANVNGTNDAGEQLIEGWKVSVSGPNGYSKEGFTTLNLLNLAFGGYTATEANSTAGTWINTTPKSASVELTEANPDGSIEFGNVCLGAGGGHTLGFWSNKNGQAQMNDGGTLEPELSMLRALNLKNPDNSNFDPTTYAQFRAWLLNGDAVNMNYMLSVQLAAMKLNVEAGFVNPTQLVYAPGVTTTSDYVSIAFLMDKANTALATTAGGRAYKEVLKNALDGANNNTNFVQRTPCNFRF